MMIYMFVGVCVWAIMTTWTTIKLGTEEYKIFRDLRRKYEECLRKYDECLRSIDEAGDREKEARDLLLDFQATHPTRCSCGACLRAMAWLRTV